MRRRFLVLTGVGLALVVMAWLAALAAVGALSYRPLRIDPGDEGRGRPWRGAVHVHTGLSHDATGGIDEIAAEAEAAGLDYIVIADHVQAEGIAGRVEGGWYGDVLVVVGEEISTDDGHLLALGIGPHPFALGPTGTQAIADVRGLGGEPVIAHPLGGEASWTDGWAGISGVEVWSLSTLVYRSSTATKLGALAGYPLNRAWAASRILEGWPPALAPWRERVRLSEAPRRLAAVGSVDAHGPPRGLRWLGAPSHRDAFEALATLVWLDEPPDPDPDRHRVVAGRLVEALVAGRSAVVATAVGETPGLQVTAESESGGVVLPGGAAPWEAGPWTIRGDLGAAGAYRIRLLLDDREVAVSDGSALRRRVEAPGTYHLEIERTDGPGGGTPWVIVNPIYVWPRRALEAAEFRPVPPLPAPPVSRGLLDERGWSPESHPAASSTVAVGDPGLRWDLGLPGRPGESVFAALSWRPSGPLDVTSRGGLVVGLRSPRPWRIAVRVAFADGDGERVWERVVPSLPSGRAVGIPWWRFRPLGSPEAGPATIDAPMLERLSRISLVVTQERVRPGTEATVEVLQLGFYGGG